MIFASCTIVQDLSDDTKNMAKSVKTLANTQTNA